MFVTLTLINVVLLFQVIMNGRIVQATIQRLAHLTNVLRNGKFHVIGISTGIIIIKCIM